MKKKVLLVVLLAVMNAGIAISCSANDSKKGNDGSAEAGAPAKVEVKNDPVLSKSEVAIESMSAENAVMHGEMAVAAVDNDELARVVREGKVIAIAHKSTDTAVGKKSKNASDVSGFVLLSDVIPDVIMEARYYSTYNFVGKRVNGYEEPVVVCTREAAAALKKVADELRGKGYLLKVFDAYRPQKAVDHFCSWAQTSDQKMKADFYPGLEKNKLFPTYIARKSGHTRGSTFDLTITDMNGKDVDMGGPFDFFGTKSHYAYSGVTTAQANNRKILHDAMIAHGFKPYSNEWWHFTLKNEPYPNTYFTFPVTSKLF